LKDKDKTDLKKLLLTECMEKQLKLADTSKDAMNQSQESANGEKGMMGDKFESFREQMQIDRDMHAKQYEAALVGLASLKKIDPEKHLDLVALGSIVITDIQYLFISASLGKIGVGRDTYVAVSTGTPIYNTLAGKKKGDTFLFKGRTHKILDLF
jgi:hypothetical protein